MSCFGLKRRLLPSKKIMRGFTSLLKSNLQKLRPAKATSASPGVSRRGRHLRPRRKSAHAATKLSHHARHFAPVYVDELFHHQPAEADMKQQAAEAQAAAKLQKPHRQTNETAASTSDFGEFAMAEVDYRAEVFIRMFKEEMRLQRQKSIVEYQEMLARGLS